LEDAKTDDEQGRCELLETLVGGERSDAPAPPGDKQHGDHQPAYRHARQGLAFVLARAAGTMPSP
jgi:hypothetical protein